MQWLLEWRFGAASELDQKVWRKTDQESRGGKFVRRSHRENFQKVSQLQIVDAEARRMQQNDVQQMSLLLLLAVL